MASEAEKQIRDSVQLLDSAEKDCRAAYVSAIDMDDIQAAFATQKDMTTSVRLIKKWKRSFESILEEMRMNPIL